MCVSRSAALQPSALYISAAVYNIIHFGPKKFSFFFYTCVLLAKKMRLLHIAALQPTALYISAVVKWATAPVPLSRCTQPHIALSHFQCFVALSHFQCFIALSHFQCFVTVMKYYSATSALFQFKCGHKGLLCHY